MRTTSRGRRGRRRLVTALLAVLATASLTACDPDQAGAAAIVDDHVITTQQLQDATEAYLRVVPNADRTTVQQRLLERMILTDVIAKAARDNDVHASVGSVAHQRDQIYVTTHNAAGLVRALSQQQSPIVVAPSQIDQWVRDQVLVHRMLVRLAPNGDVNSDAAQQRIGSELASTGKTMSIKVSPRYGHWVPNRGIRALKSGGLAYPAAQLNAGD